MKCLWLGWSVMLLKRLLKYRGCSQGKVPEAVRLRRAKDKALGIIADARADAFNQPLEVDPLTFSRSKRVRLESGLNIYYGYTHGGQVLDLLAFWIAMVQDPRDAFSAIAKLFMNVFLIPAMTADHSQMTVTA